MKSKGKSTKKNEIKGILVQKGCVTRGRGKQTRKVTWKSDSELVEIQEFENDENERSNSAKFEKLKSLESEIENAPKSSKTDVEKLKFNKLRKNEEKDPTDENSD